MGAPQDVVERYKGGRAVTITISIAAIAIASLGFLLALMQFITRHRPFVSVDGLFVEKEPGVSGKFLDVQVTNVGEVPARNLSLFLQEDPFPDWAITSTSFDAFGVIFPGQSLRVRVNPDFDVNSPSDHAVAAVANLNIIATLNYESPLSLKKVGFGVHKTVQYLFLRPDRWGHRPGSTFS